MILHCVIDGIRIIFIDPKLEGHVVFLNYNARFTAETLPADLKEAIVKLFLLKKQEFIKQINKLHNDGLILKSFENTSLEENCIKQPCFKLKFTSGEYSEKDRIIENEVFNVCLEIILQSQLEKKSIMVFRYLESISNLFFETETVFSYRIERQLENKIYIRINQESYSDSICS